MSSNVIGIDIGYSATKVIYKGQCAKFPTAVSYATDVGISYGDQDVYSFEGESFVIGKEAVSGESFNTIDFKFLCKYAPLIIYHILKRYDCINLSRPITVKTGLAIVDWGNREEFIKRISNFKVNDEDVRIEVEITPQGGGIYKDWMHSSKIETPPYSLHILDIGYNTINSIHFEEGKPIRSKTNSYPGHGVSSVIKPFAKYLENKFKFAFSESEAIACFTNKKFVYNGVPDEDVVKKIDELSNQMVKKLFQSVLVSEKKTLSTSEVVIIGGGGAYLLKDVRLPGNVKLITDYPEYSNVRGYIL